MKSVFLLSILSIFMFLSATESASLIKLLAKRQIILGGGTIGEINQASNYTIVFSQPATNMNFNSWRPHEGKPH